MKRLLALAHATLLVFVLLAAPCFAANNSYYVEDLGMTIALPSDHIVFTRDINASDPNLNAYGLTKDGLYSLMLDRNIYLNAWDADINYEIIVTMMDSPFEDYNLFSDTSLSAVVSGFEAEYESVGITFIDADIYQHDQAKFAVISTSQPFNGGTVYSLQYNTVYDSKAINITLHSYSGGLDSAKRTILKELVDTVHFDKDPLVNSTPTQTEAFLYTDPTSGMTFTVPANWVEASMLEEREYIDAKFASTIEDGLVIIFTCEDIFSDELLEELGSEVGLVSRSDINNSLLTKEDVASMFADADGTVTMVTYRGKEYFMLEAEQSGALYGYDMKVPLIALVRCENGFMYMFQFNGSKDSPYFSDLVSLLNSITYPVLQESHNQNSGATSSQKQNNVDVDSLQQNSADSRRTSDWLALVFVLVASTAIIIFIISAHNRKQRRVSMPDQKQEAAISIDNIHEQQPTEPQISMLFCYNCGCKLKPESRFCHNCGTVIPEGSRNIQEYGSEK